MSAETPTSTIAYNYDEVGGEIGTASGLAPPCFDVSDADKVGRDINEQVSNMYGSDDKVESISVGKCGTIIIRGRFNGGRHEYLTFYHPTIPQLAKEFALKSLGREYEQSTDPMFVAMIQTKKMKNPGDDPGWALFGPWDTRQEASDYMAKVAPNGLPGSIMRVQPAMRLISVVSGAFDSHAEN